MSVDRTEVSALFPVLEPPLRADEAGGGRVPLRDSVMAYRLLLEAAAGRPEHGLAELLSSWVARCSPLELDHVIATCDQLAAVCRQQKG